MATSKINKKTNWNPTDKRFVAFLDILGFRDLVMRSSHSKIYDLLTDLSKKRSSLESIENYTALPERFSDAGLYTASFSDSIFIFSKNASVENFELFSLMTSWFFAQVIEKQIPIKGAIAVGDISINKSNQIYFGQPIIDAFLLEEELSYLGVVCHNSIDEYLSSIPDENIFKQRYMDIFTPFKYGLISHLNINWFIESKYYDEGPRKENLKYRINELRKQTSGNPRRYIDNTIKIIDEIYSIQNLPS